MTSSQFRLFLALLTAFNKERENNYTTARITIELDTADMKKAVEILLTHSEVRFSVIGMRLSFGAV